MEHCYIASDYMSELQIFQVRSLLFVPMFHRTYISSTLKRQSMFLPLIILFM